MCIRLFPLAVVILWCISAVTAQIPADSIPPLVDSLIKVSRTHTRTAAFTDAFAASQNAGEAAQVCCGQNSAAYAAYCFNEGRIRYFMGRHKEALPWYVQARELRGTILGTDDLEYGKSCNNLAIAYAALGRYRAAEPLYLETLAIRAAKVGKRSRPYASSLYNLAELYEQTSDLEKAERLALEVQEIYEELYGTQHPTYAKVLSALGKINYRTNNLERAKQYFLQAKSIHEAQANTNAYSYVLTLSNLGALHQHYQEFELAEQYYNEAAQLQSEIWGTDFYDYALSLNHLAAIYQYTERLPQAEANLLEALAILERLSLADELYYGLFLQNLGDVYLAQDKAQIALETHQNALARIGQHVSPNHPQYLQGLIALTDCTVQLKDYSKAEMYLRQTASLEEKNLTHAVRYLPEDELNNYTQDFRRSLYRYFSLASAQPSLADLCYDKVLFYKGFLLNAALQLKSTAGRHQTTTADYQQLQEKHRQLAALYSQANTNQQLLDSLEWELTKLEKSFVRQTADQGLSIEQTTWTEVQKELSPQEVAIEFIHYEARGATSDLSEDTQYAALLLSPGSTPPLFIPLSPQSVLEELLAQKESTQEVSSFINALYDSTAQGAALHQAIWAPIEAELSEQNRPERIYFSASGLLHRLNLAALPSPTGQTLDQRYDLRQLTSTRLLVRPPVPATTTTDQRKAVLYGGIDYGEVEVTGTVENAPLPEASSSAGTRSYQPRGYNRSNGQWQPLAWTEIEVRTAEDLLLEANYQSQVLTHSDATESAVRSLGQTERSPYLLHLATHGYFFPNGKTEGPAQKTVFSESENAMIRSGLILADANYAWKYGKPRHGETEDGILTAYEVSQLNLQDTELVILSACETGLGDVQETEGVYGLQRAFKVAGTRYLIMTLWQIPDFETQTFMSTFYFAWLDEGKTIPEAFQAAQAYMRARYDSPFQWAPFVLLE